MNHFFTGFLLALLVACTSEGRYKVKDYDHPEKIGKMITTPGQYPYSHYGGEVEIFKEEEKLNFRIAHETGRAWSSSEPPIEPDGNWFVYIETWNKVWIYDGKGKLYLSYAAKDMNMACQLSRGKNTLATPPPREVMERLPPEFKDYLKLESKNMQ